MLQRDSYGVHNCFVASLRHYARQGISSSHADDKASQDEFNRSHPDVLRSIKITKQYTSNISTYYTSWLHVSTLTASSSGLLIESCH
jgi:spermidine synthase